MSEPTIRKLGDVIPGHRLPEALELASQFIDRPVAEVRTAIYYSAEQLETRVTEDPTAPQHIRKWGPHWAIMFSREDGQIDGVFAFLDAEGVSVFDDGVVMKAEENEVDWG